MRPLLALSFDLSGDFAACLEFFSRLPVPAVLFAGRDRPPLARAMRMLPLAGLVIGTGGAAALAACDVAGLPPILAATVAVTALVTASGALHEDGLADTADGFGGGATRERKLAIMRDSRIGTYGVLAIGLALIGRVTALASLLAGFGLRAGVAAVLASAAMSRAMVLLPLLALDPARPDGAGRTAGRPGWRGTALPCCGLALAIGLGLPALTRLGVAHGALACCLGTAAGAWVVVLARRHLGGHTGDVAGATQQAAELAFLLGLLAFPS